MFFKRKNKLTAPPINVAVEFMPAEFFGGVNPIVQFKDKTVGPKAPDLLTAPEKKAFDKATTASAGQKFHLANLLLNRKFMFLGAAGLFAIFAVAGSVYYFWPVIFSGKGAVSTVPPAPSNHVVALPPPTTNPAPAPMATPISEPVAPPEIVPTSTFSDTKIAFPSVLIADSADFDHDDITDVAEELFSTDPGVPDSDGDKYEDGHELFNLYNPAGKEPERLIASGIVSEYVNPVFNYKLYYPSNWAVGSVDEQGRDVLFSTLTGENIEVRVYDLSAGQTLAEWMAIFAPTETVQSLVDFSTAFKDIGKRRSDYLVYYFVHKERVYVLVYHTVENEAANYRSVIKMMARSFRPNNVVAADLAPPLTEAPAVDSGATTGTAVIPAGR